MLGAECDGAGSFDREYLRQFDGDRVPGPTPIYSIFPGSAERCMPLVIFCCMIIQVLHNEVCLNLAKLNLEQFGIQSRSIIDKPPLGFNTELKPLDQRTLEVLETYTAFTRKSYRFIPLEVLLGRLRYNMDTMAEDPPPTRWLDSVFSKFSALRLGCSASSAAGGATSGTAERRNGCQGR